MEFLLEFPLIPLGAFVVLSGFFAYQLKLYLGEKKKTTVPHIPNLMTNATPLVLPAVQQSQAFMHKMATMQQEHKKQSNKTQKGVSFAQAFYVFTLLFFFITTTTLFIFARNKKITFLPRANLEPTTFPTVSLLPTIPERSNISVTASPTDVARVTTSGTGSPSPTGLRVQPTITALPSSVSPTVAAVQQTLTPTVVIAPTISVAANKAVGGLIPSPTTTLLAKTNLLTPTIGALITNGSVPSVTPVLLGQYGQYNPVVYPSSTPTPLPRMTGTPTTQIPKAGIGFASIGLLLVSVTLLFVGFAL